MYDILIVGAGISGATVAAYLKHKLKILVVDVRPYMGGNCYDYRSGKTYVHLHGPHNWHCKDDEIWKFVSQYTTWKPYQAKVEAEIEWEHKLKRVPFPYSHETTTALGRILTNEEITDLFFRGYSEKMWGLPFEHLPSQIQNRVPRHLETSNYFPESDQATPEYGYTEMIQNMLYGVDVQLNVPPDYWKTIPARKIVYCGRLDLVLSGSRKLPYRSLDITFNHEKWDSTATTVNFCHKRCPSTRKTNYGFFHGDPDFPFVSYEMPRQGQIDEISPYYPIPSDQNRETYNLLKQEVLQKYPNLIPLGRLGTYKYLNMDQAVGQGMKVAMLIDAEKTH